MSLPLTRRLADVQPWLDRLADRVQPPVRDFLERHRRLHDLLDGTWFGAPLHPALTDVPIGSWVAAFALDAVGELTDSPAIARAADAALLVGVVGALPTAATGAGDWRDLTGEQRRIATLHAVLNTVGLGLTVASLAQRARGHRGSGRALSATGMAVSGLAAHLGGALSFGVGVRVNRSSFLARTVPADFTPVLQDDELSAEAMRRVDVDGFPVLLARDHTGRPCAITETCSHLGGPLASGQRSGDVVTCPWHGSRFDLRTGEVVEGPAVFPQQVYQARVRDGAIELRRPAAGNPDEAEHAVAARQPSFEHDIRPLFRTTDIDAMAAAFDLSSYQDVRDHANEIYQALSKGSMPCDGAWPAEHVQEFHAWMDAGYPR